jgi:hypothetical protein
MEKPAMCVEVERRAHARIDDLTGKFSAFHLAFQDHVKQHNELEESVKENTELTRATANNTGELVKIFKGAKAMRSFFVWASPVAAAIAGVYAFLPWVVEKFSALFRGM